MAIFLMPKVQFFALLPLFVLLCLRLEFAAWYAAPKFALLWIRAPGTSAHCDLRYDRRRQKVSVLVQGETIERDRGLS